MRFPPINLSFLPYIYESKRNNNRKKWNGTFFLCFFEDIITKLNFCPSENEISKNVS